MADPKKLQKANAQTGDFGGKLNRLGPITENYYNLPTKDVTLEQLQAQSRDPQDPGAFHPVAQAPQPVHISSFGSNSTNHKPLPTAPLQPSKSAAGSGGNYGPLPVTTLASLASSNNASLMSPDTLIDTSSGGGSPGDHYAILLTKAGAGDAGNYQKLPSTEQKLPPVASSLPSAPRASQSPQLASNHAHHHSHTNFGSSSPMQPQHHSLSPAPGGSGGIYLQLNELPAKGSTPPAAPSTPTSASPAPGDGHYAQFDQLFAKGSTTPPTAQGGSALSSSGTYVTLPAQKNATVTPGGGSPVTAAAATSGNDTLALALGLDSNHGLGSRMSEALLDTDGKKSKDKPKSKDKKK